MSIIYNTRFNKVTKILTANVHIKESQYNYNMCCYHQTTRNIPIERTYHNICYTCTHASDEGSQMCAFNVYYPDLVYSLCKKCDKFLMQIYDSNMSKYPSMIYYGDTFQIHHYSNDEQYRTHAEELYNTCLIAEVTKCLLMWRVTECLVDVNAIIRKYYLNNIHWVEKLLPFVSSVIKN